MTLLSRDRLRLCPIRVARPVKARPDRSLFSAAQQTVRIPAQTGPEHGFGVRTGQGVCVLPRAPASASLRCAAQSAVVGRKPRLWCLLENDSTAATATPRAGHVRQRPFTWSLSDFRLALTLSFVDAMLVGRAMPASPDQECGEETRPTVIAGVFIRQGSTVPRSRYETRSRPRAAFEGYADGDGRCVYRGRGGAPSAVEDRRMLTACRRPWRPIDCCYATGATTTARHSRR